MGRSFFATTDSLSEYVILNVLLARFGCLPVVSLSELGAAAAAVR